MNGHLRVKKRKTCWVMQNTQVNEADMSVCLLAIIYSYHQLRHVALLISVYLNGIILITSFTIRTLLSQLTALPSKN